MDFKKVKKRAGHTHLRCTDCAEIGARLTLALARGDDEEARAAKAARGEHEQAIRSWRDMEKFYIGAARDDPFNMNLFYADDTEKMGFPHFTRRDVKAGAAPTPMHYTRGHTHAEVDSCYSARKPRMLSRL